MKMSELGMAYCLQLTGLGDPRVPQTVQAIALVFGGPPKLLDGKAQLLKTLHTQVTGLREVDLKYARNLSP